MRLYIVFFLAVIYLCTTDAAGRKKIVGTKKVDQSKNSQNVTDTTKSIEKATYPKKVTSLKKRPTKSPQLTSANSTLIAIDAKKPLKDVTEAFENLPEDDLEFIKELDKQFKLHGGNLKIKVQRDNSSDSKNSKRTIEGDLGYGYAPNGYSYERPKFMFYPYSQKDIPSDAPGYFPQYESTSVKIEPSYSYELNPQTYLVTHAETTPHIDLPQVSQAEQAYNEPQHAHHQDDNQEPVIVLRIPGPTKYATHLQALLQQYLEIRAAQYLRILQETEARKHQNQGQQYEEHYSNQGYNYEQQLPSQHVEPPADYNAEVSYTDQVAPTPEPIMYPTIDEVYHNYKEHYQHQQALEQQQQQQQDHANAQIYQNSHTQVSQSDASPQYYYSGEQDAHQQQNHPGYEQVYVIAMSPAMYSNDEQHYSVSQHPIYVQEEDPHQADHYPSTSENNPRSTHTKIMFTQNPKSSAVDQSNMYPLPSIRPFDRHTPTSQPPYHQEYQAQSVADLDYQQSAPAQSGPHQETVSITQRPFNYHAHQSKNRSRPGRKRATAHVMSSTTSPTPKTVSPKSDDETEQHLQKIRQYVHEKLGAQTGSTIEIKTTNIVNG